MSLSHRSALIIGLGGLGCPAAVGLAAGGVGSLTLLDDDRVDSTNLGRQMLFGEGDIGAGKAETAAAALLARFPSLRVRALSRRFGRDEELPGEPDIVLDGSDNFPTRFAANDACIAAGIPLVHGAALQWLGQLLTILPRKTACLRCVFEGEPPPGTAPTCGQAGVFSPLVGLIGSAMAREALAVLSGAAPATAGAMLVHDLWRGVARLAPLGRDPACLVCGDGR
jgi:adenylyltransferase/sulfurtransferase